jgi:hypothetical protein
LPSNIFYPRFPFKQEKQEHVQEVLWKKQGSEVVLGWATSDHALIDERPFNDPFSLLSYIEQEALSLHQK